eukprot:TRINITY_DN3840_c0_g1_i1.p1 TRINITY_DN3840_c0_g1~~TRINITY_DN3840_c0_g1_i1.p1  ORF type:complete len:320 (+),score=75.06 TRINITY_DN3840_c0_g1_i1:870-1829(+)
MIKFQDKWHHTKAFSLKSATMDPSFIRERLSMALLESLVAPIYRGSFAVLYINQQYFGLFHMLEDVDNAFLKSRFGEDTGLLYKCPDYDNPDYTSLCGPANDAARNISSTRIKELTTLLDNAAGSDPKWVSEVKSLMDVPLLLRTIVYESASSAWDGFALGWNNIYFYFSERDQNWKIFRHDVDCVFGLGDTWNWLSIRRNVYFQDMQTSNKPRQILMAPEFKSQYEQYYCALLAKYFNLESSFKTYIEELHNMMLRAASLDVWHKLDYDWTWDKVMNSLDEPIERPTFNVAILDFLSLRYQNVSRQLQCESLPQGFYL